MDRDLDYNNTIMICPMMYFCSEDYGRDCVHATTHYPNHLSSMCECWKEKCAISYPSDVGRVETGCIPYHPGIEKTFPRTKEELEEAAKDENFNIRLRT